MLQAVSKMKTNYREFGGSNSYLKTSKQLQAVAGKSSWFSEVNLTHFPFRETMYLLMSAFIRRGDCYNFSGIFVYYLAGMLGGFTGVTLYNTLRDTYLTRQLFKE